MHAYIITTTNRQTIGRKLVELLKLELEPEALFSQPDLVVLESQDSLTIAQIRRLHIQLSRRPLKLPKQIGLILGAERMTVPAQNAFLKLLEEPTANTVLVLATSNPYQLLPTLLSRSQIVAVADKAIPDQEPDDDLAQLIRQLGQACPGERLSLVEPFGKNRDAALIFCARLLGFLESQLHQPDPTLSPAQAGKLLKQTLALKRHLDANLNVKLALDHWALALPS
jgi:hypothetical protein